MAHFTVASVAVASDGTSVASGGADGTVCIWDVETGKVRMRLRQHDGKQGCRCHILPDSGLPAHISALCAVTGLLCEVTSVAFSQDCRRIATGDGGGQVHP
ncbi:hypothetical protein T484DRAFT_1912848 [Baffinella frigidus]|nr:hypothetical protein T484DRAFT_1912848 [Cryptophyta sp. CCMP2293]